MHLEKPLEIDWVGLKVGWSKALGNHQCGEMCEPGWWSLRYGARLPALSVGTGGGVHQRNNGFCQHFSLWESCFPSFFSEARQFNSSPDVSGTFKAAAPMLEPEGVSQSQPVHGSVKRNCLGFQQFPSSLASIPAGFYIQKLWGLLFLVLDPWTADLMYAWEPLLPRYPSWYLSTTCGCNASLFCIFAPPTSLNEIIFLNSVIVGLPFSFISGGSEWWLSWSLVIILMWLWEESRQVQCWAVSPSLPEVLALGFVF